MPIHEDSNEHSKSLISRLTPPWAKSRAALVTLATVAVLAVAGTTFGYAALSKSVTLSLDGKTEQVTAMGGTVVTSSTPRASRSDPTTSWPPAWTSR